MVTYSTPSTVLPPHLVNQSPQQIRGGQRRDHVSEHDLYCIFTIFLKLIYYIFGRIRKRNHVDNARIGIRRLFIRSLKDYLMFWRHNAVGKHPAETQVTHDTHDLIP